MKSKDNSSESAVFWGIIKAVGALYIGTLVFQSAMYAIFPPEDDLSRSLGESQESMTQNLEDINRTMDKLREEQAGSNN